MVVWISDTTWACHLTLSFWDVPRYRACKNDKAATGSWMRASVQGDPSRYVATCAQSLQVTVLHVGDLALHVGRAECGVWGSLMHEPASEFVERVSDQGQWFDQGMRVEFFQVRPSHRELEKAALGSYEVLDCTRVEDDHGAWLDVKLRRAVRATRVRRVRS